MNHTFYEKNFKNLSFFYIAVLISLLTFINLNLAEHRVIDLLKDELEAVFQFSSVESQTSFYFMQESIDADVVVRKISNNENKFLIFLENITYEGNLNCEEQMLDETDLNAMQLPIIVTTDDDFKIHKLKTMKSDSEQSIKLKSSVLSLLRTDFSIFFSNSLKSMWNKSKSKEQKEKILKETSTITNKTYHTILGECECIIELQNGEEFLDLSLATSRSECQGPIDFDETMAEITINPSRNSTFNKIYFLDWNTMGYAGSEVFFNIEDADDSSFQFLHFMIIIFDRYDLRQKNFQFTEYSYDWN